jgi:hypothetical protein
MFWENYAAGAIPLTIRTSLGYVYKKCTLYADWEKHFYRYGNLNESTFHFGI